MYNRTYWDDHVVNEEGEVMQQGTPVSEDHLNNMEQGIHAANVAAIMAMNTARLAMEAADSNVVIKNITLTNALAYPFNNSKTTVALDAAEERHNTNYVVIAEVTNCVVTDGSALDSESVNNAGLAGNIVVSDKMTNGFKVEFTGSAGEVSLKLYIVGGM